MMKKINYAFSMLLFANPALAFRLAGVCLILLLCSPAIADEQESSPKTNGLSLPMPTEPVSFPLPFDIVPSIERLVPFVLTIDSFGVVQDYVSKVPADSLFLSSSDSLLRKLEFIPGKFMGQKRTMYLPILVHSWPRSSGLRLKFPVDHKARVTDLALYEQGLSLNGIRTAVIDTFPSYYCDYVTSEEDTLSIYPFVLARLSIGSNGELVALDKIVSTAGTFTDQLLSVINWGAYQPLRESGQPKTSSPFMLISLYPQINYPTSTKQGIVSDSATTQEKWRVRILADTLGPFLAPPIPQRYQDMTYTAVDSSAVAYQKISVSVRIDNKGEIHVGRVNSLSFSLKKLVREILGRQRFYPAIDFSGQPKSFNGLFYLDFSTSGIVRIIPNWL